jgi:hypothetical protein
MATTSAAELIEHRLQVYFDAQEREPTYADWIGLANGT